ncbi:DUF11 domain-containing protein [Sphaerisporangium corydalis]|uniref:DUF11 domain-containing protein n=1 Tax=Sphaerisporangium corydalis TaxID=1441875 RepID=A0ABV9EAR7_9ACTN|nr:DUF11 domain-containing protein [Sphaerisporangium corydalis]
MGLLSAGAAAGLALLVAAGALVAHASSGRPPGPWGGADLSVRVAASPRVAQPGRWLAYEVRVSNAGPADAVLPVLTIKVPDEVDIATVNVATCRPGRTRNEVVCPSATDIPPGDSGAVTVLGVVRMSARGPLRASASLSSEVADGNEKDNRAELTTRVAGGAERRSRTEGRTARTEGRITRTEGRITRAEGRSAADRLSRTRGAHRTGRGATVGSRGEHRTRGGQNRA